VSVVSPGRVYGELAYGVEQDVFHEEEGSSIIGEEPVENRKEVLIVSESLVSVKMITYNHASYIAQAIEGVLGQKTNFPFELVIGEDCSTDGTRETVFEYQKKYPNIIRVITSSTNVGMKKNGDRASKALRGKYVAWCEGDDYWQEPLKLQRQADYMETHPDWGLLLCDSNVHYANNGKVIYNYNYRKGFCSIEQLGIEQIIDAKMAYWTASAIAQRKLCEQVIEADSLLYKDGRFLMGDTQLWAELSMISKVVYIPDCMSTYRVLDDSASRSKDVRKQLRFWKSAYEMKLYLIDKYRLSDQLRRKIESKWCDVSLMLAFYTRDSDLARQVRNKKQRFSWKESIRYLGVKSSPINFTYRLAVSTLNKFRKQDTWP
jgi:glycosyltransferase involved in cell wall biosynthesis